MNMNMKLKSTLIASVLAFAVAGPANAAIVDMNTGSSDLVLNIWDATSLTSYTEDLGINMSTFMAGVSGTPTTLVANSSGISFSPFVADTTLSNWLGTVNLGTTSWSITAGDRIGTGFQGQNFLTTSTGTSMTVSNLNLTAGGTNAQNFFSLMSTVTGTNHDAVGSGSSYAGGALAAGGGWGSKWTNTSAAIGSTLNFLYMTPSSTSNVASAAVKAFNGGLANSTWTLASNGTLSFANGAPVVAVPEPGEWALMLSGFGLIGFIALRRKNTSMTFA